MAHTVMARLVRAIYSSTCAATGGPDTPGHDDAGTFPAIRQASDSAVVSEMFASGRDKPGHDDPDDRPSLWDVPTYLRFAVTNQTTLLNRPLRQHSRKPDAFYTMVDNLCPAPAGGKVEMFCRQARPGWIAAGAEISKFEAVA